MLSLFYLKQLPSHPLDCLKWPSFGHINEKKMVKCFLISHFKHKHFSIQPMNEKILSSILPSSHSTCTTHQVFLFCFVFVFFCRKERAIKVVTDRTEIHFWQTYGYMCAIHLYQSIKVSATYAIRSSDSPSCILGSRSKV